MALSTKWINHIEAWQRSGLKQAEYCRQQGLNDNTFGARLSDYRKEHQGALPALIPVQLKAPLPVGIVLKHASGHQVDLPSTTSAAWLAELLRCLD
jgi:hypothetical protein